MVNHVPTPVFVIMVIASFFGGRYSYLLMKNRYIEKKLSELSEFREEVGEEMKLLCLKDEEIRNKWKSMVEDFAKYQAYVESDTNSQWTEWDDVYLNSWISAER